MTKLKFFISYSHLDMKYKERLMLALKQLENIYNIEIWQDGRIPAGQNIDENVLKQLSKADVVLLIMTPNFMASWYCMKVELEKSITRMQQGDCVVVPVMFMDCLFDETQPFSRLKRVPSDGKPICKFKPQGNGCTEAVTLIKEMIDVTFADAILTRNDKSDPKNKLEKEKRVFINLYENGELKPHTVNQEFISLLPECTRNIIDFNTMMVQATNNAIKRFKSQYRKIIRDSVIRNMEAEELRLFLMDVCSYIKTYITDPVGIRVHFRGRVNNHYVGIVASTDNDDSDDLATDWTTDLTPIPVYEGLIHHSSKVKGSLLKSLNPKLNYKGNHDEI